MFDVCFTPYILPKACFENFNFYHRNFILKVINIFQRFVALKLSVQCKKNAS